LTPSLRNSEKFCCLQPDGAAIAGVYFESYFGGFDYLKARPYCRQNAFYSAPVRAETESRPRNNRINRRTRFDLAPTLDL
jgi:hypothetical protein